MRHEIYACRFAVRIHDCAGVVCVGDDRGSFPELKAMVNGMIPLGRAGIDMEVAHAVRFLASEKAGYITGHVLKVNGGNANGLDEVTIS